IQRDMTGAKEAKEIYNNLINPQTVSNSKNDDEDTGYKNSERSALEKQLLQIESVANSIQESEQ
ncbi:MAG: hypothetical protein MJ156_02940, partial [Alphaproteobacteria bacterium]|nr:hypothetical protein [Alphaproteobacteria bacterium]